jgi:hypothetical protein
MDQSELSKQNYDAIASILLLNINNHTTLRTILDLLVWQQRQGMTSEQVDAHKEWLAERLKTNQEVSNANLILAKKQ